MTSNLELYKNANDLFYRLIVLNLAMRVLEIDKAKLSTLKISRPLISWYEKQISEMWSESKDVKKRLSALGGKGDLSAEKDGDVQIYTLLFRGSSYPLRYMSIVLKNHVENEIAKRLGVEYIQNPYEEI